MVIPVYNAAQFLRESIDSVLSQNYPAIEVIAVDDGSTDGSLEILLEYGGRITVIEQSRKGAAAARNAGVRAAKGRLIAFQDADDVWLPGKLVAQVEYLLANPATHIVFSQFAFWHADEAGRYRDPSWFVNKPDTWELKQELSGYIYADELLDSCIAMIVPVIRREVFDAVGGFDEQLYAGSDYDFWLKATARFRAHKMPRCFALYRIHERGITGTPKTTNFSYLVLSRAIERTGLAGPDGRRADKAVVEKRLADSWLYFAEVHLKRGDRRIAGKALRTYVRLSGFRPRALANYVIVRAEAFTRRRQPIS